MEKNKGGLKGIFEKITTSLAESGEEKTKRGVATLFPSVPHEKLDQFMESFTPDSNLTYRENLIKAVLEGLGPTTYEAHTDHPDRDVRFVAQSLAYGAPVKSVRFEE